jgi:hypothetical protein
MVRRIEEQRWKVADAASAAGLSVRRTYHRVGRNCAGRGRMRADSSGHPTLPAE